MDLDGMFDTKTAAAKLGMEPKDVTAYLKRFPHLKPPKLGNLFIWSIDTVQAFSRWKEAMDAGKCPHCREQIEPAKTATTAEPPLPGDDPE